ncbi:DUF2018 family protein [Sulfurimonas autotrophica]|uniref:DUF2018 family protein n=1 Tax=Sulfurimonas autotrophica (strain ATCC BAA-671 / DSM 16294 / JCM 11897 / OK10) TaxID=563040 RepID=E0URK7_SULAO|nr:DUF2018 family protein [Sulfurimonas autotrophica]ADN08951.1 Domain of unknown function DUF2018 [Sulfurimonas autotrophica DSM 16294]
MSYSALFEDEEDIFGGSPRSKFMDVVFNANNDIVRQELENFIEKAATMELMLEEQLGEDVDDAIARYKNSHLDDVNTKTKSIFVEIMGSILSQSE